MPRFKFSESMLQRKTLQGYELQEVFERFTEDKSKSKPITIF